MIDFEKNNEKKDYSKCLNLLKKLHAIQCRVEYLQKNTKGYNYKYVSGIDVLEKIKPLMEELKLILIPAVIGQRFERFEYIKKNEKAINQITVVDFLYTWVDVENGEYLEIPFGGQGLSNEDKGFGMACTYSERYFLLKFFHIATDEDDPDNYVSQNKSIGKQNEENINNVFNSENNVGIAELNMLWDVFEQFNKTYYASMNPNDQKKSLNMLELKKTNKLNYADLKNTLDDFRKIYAKDDDIPF